MGFGARVFGLGAWVPGSVAAALNSFSGFIFYILRRSPSRLCMTRKSSTRQSMGMVSDDGTYVTRRGVVARDESRGRRSRRGQRTPASDSQAWGHCHSTFYGHEP